MVRFLFLVSIALLSCSENSKEFSMEIDITEDIVDPEHYIVAKSSEQLTIDGHANEPAWQSASFSNLFIDIEGVKIPKYETRMKMLWDENYLYVFAQMEEPHIWGDLKQRDTIIFFNNDFEIFISPSGTTRNYVEVEINALGTVWDLSLDKPYRDQGKAKNYWNLHDLKSAVQINGTLNNPEDVDSHWTVEIAIPMKALIEVKNKPRSTPVEGEQWLVNSSRVQWDHDIVDGVYQRKKENDKFLREYNWVWSSQNVINMHEPEKWGVIQFTENPVSEDVRFIEDDNTFSKQVAFSLYRRTSRGNLKDLLNEKAGYSTSLLVRYSEKNSMKAVFYKTHFGFEYIINNPGSNDSFIINESGTLKKLK